jgi:hypothetical protein
MWEMVILHALLLAASVFSLGVAVWFCERVTPTIPRQPKLTTSTGLWQLIEALSEYSVVSVWQARHSLPEITIRRTLVGSR